MDKKAAIGGRWLSGTVAAAKTLKSSRSFCLIASVIGFFMLSTFSLSTILYPSIPSSANSSSNTLAVGATVQEFLRLAVDTSAVALADSQGHTTIAPNPNTGTQITGDINVAVTTNTGTGYNLTVLTQDNTKNMTHSLPTVDTAINSIDSISGYDASTGASALSDNTWGFRKNTGTNESPVYTNWYAVGAKDSTGTVIDSPGEGTGAYCDSLSYPLNQSGCNPSSYRTYNINVGAKLTSSLPVGTYTNDIVFSATTKAEGTKYTMNFNSNGGNAGNVINPRIVVAGLSVNLPTSGFTKDGYVIKGWAFTDGATTPVYTAGQTVATNDLILAARAAGQDTETNNSFTVYAVWEKIKYMQDFEASTLATGDAIILVDQRDNSEYLVEKLPDDKVWMKQNLRLAKAMTLTPSDSDVSSNFDLAAPMSTDTSWCTTGGCIDTPNTYYTESRSAYGAIYNWYTATAGIGTRSATGNISSSICPKGWRLPIGGSTGDFINLDIALGGDGTNRANDPTIYAKYKDVAGFDLPGTINSTLILVGEYGRWWSATGPSGNTNAAIYMYIDLRNNTDTIYPSAFNSKSFGGSVRCIARQ